MYFENFYEEIGQFDESILTDFKQNLFNVDLSDPLLNRPEYCFRDGGRLILPMNFAEVMNEEYYPYVEPLIQMIQATGHPCLSNTVPYRVEISIIRPGKGVLWHQDQHVCHKFSERIHVPIITNDSVEFMSKWFLEDRAYKFKMQPGHIYRYNNRVTHTVKNPSDQFRCHVIVDFIHKNVLDYFLNTGAERLTSNVTVTPVDEIYYMVNHQPRGVEVAELTADDQEQLDTMKDYYLLRQDPRADRKSFTPEQAARLDRLNAIKNY
jgi:hypothetical protein